MFRLITIKNFIKKHFLIIFQSQIQLIQSRIHSQPFFIPICKGISILNILSSLVG
jgi:hypothetical protein